MPERSPFRVSARTVGNMDRNRLSGKRTGRPAGGARGWCRIVSVSVLLLTVHAVESAAQAGLQDRRDTPGWVAEFTVLGFNAVLGGLTAGIRQQVAGGSFEDGFTRGFAGGSVIYAGKRIAAERFPGAGLIGRGVAGAGGSMVRNASDGRPVLDRVVLPVGPMRLHLDRADGLDARVKFDLNAIVMASYAAARSDIRLDLASSLSAGAPVFRAEGFVFGTEADSIHAAGRVAESVIFLSDLPWRAESDAERVFAHERIHVLQRDQVFSTLADPLTSSIVDRFPALAPVYRYADFHVTGLIFHALVLPFPEYDERPWEMESFHLSGQ